MKRIALKRISAALAAWTIVALLFGGQLAVDSAYSGHRIAAPQRSPSG